MPRERSQGNILFVLRHTGYPCNAHPASTYFEEDSGTQELLKRTSDSGLQAFTKTLKPGWVREGRCGSIVTAQRVNPKPRSTVVVTATLQTAHAFPWHAS